MAVFLGGDLCQTLVRERESLITYVTEDKVVRLSAKTVLTVLLLTILGVVATGVSIELVRQGARLGLVRDQHRAEMILGHIVRGAQHLAFERGRTNVVLRADSPVGDENRRFLDDRRALVDSEYGNAIQLLDEDNTALARRLSRQQQMLGDLRQRADFYMSIPLSQRDPLFPGQWFNSLSAMLEGVPESVFLLGRRGDLPPLARVSLHAFDLRNMLGVESSRIATILAAGKPPKIEQMQELARLRGQGDAAWNSLRREAAQAGNAAVAEAVAGVEREVYRNFRPLQDAVLAAFADNRLPRESLPSYTSSSVPALDMVAKVMDVATQEGMALAQAQEQAIRRDITWHLILLAVLVLATAGSIAVNRMTLKRLQGLRDYLETAQDNPPKPVVEGFDEVAALARSITELRVEMREHHRIEAELAEMSKLNRLILDNAVDGMIALDSRGLTIFANPAAQRMTGWSLGDLEGRSHHALIHHSRADGTPNPAADCPVHLSLADGRPRRVASDLFWRKDGTSFPVELMVGSWGEGKDRGVVMVFRDISERQQVETLNQALMAELRRSNTELENFAFAVSHDLQAPLRMVSSFLALAHRALADKLDPGTAEYMDMAEQGAQRMAAMIASLLDYARIGRREENKEPVALADIVAQVMVDLRPAVEERHAKVEVVEPLPVVQADPGQIYSVVLNLLSNALKYSGEDKAPRIRVIGWSHGGRSGFAVEDNGPGIAPDSRELVFGLFKRGGPHPTIPGLGMGLAICRRIVEHLGGTIRAEDNPGGGARLLVTLPAARDAVGTGVTT